MAEEMLVLNRAVVEECLHDVDPVEVVERTLAAHARGDSQIPHEGYLAWENTEGAYCRSLAMLGAIRIDEEPLYGLKVINAAVSNPGRGLPRAGGVSFLFDPETARPRLLAEAALISAVRTASYTVASVLRLGPERFDAVGIIGCGELARTHLALFRRYFPGVRVWHLHDIDPRRASGLAAWWEGVDPESTTRVEPGPAEVLRSAPVVVTLTTSSDPYIPRAWVAPGGFVAHVSLDDLTEEAFRGAEAIYVDDVDLVRDNPRRILGRLLQEQIVAAEPGVSGPRLAGTLGEVLIGRAPAVRPSDGYVVSNPFGMSILDVAMLAEVERVALKRQLGDVLDLVGTR